MSTRTMRSGVPGALKRRFFAPLPKSRLVMAVGFITMFKAGPGVSVCELPTASPVTDVLCAWPRWRFNFLARPLCVRPPLPDGASPPRVVAQHCTDKG